MRHFLAVFLVSLLLASGIAPAQTALLQGLSGSGGKVTLLWGDFPDGTKGTFRASPTPEGGISLTIKATIELKTPDFQLNSEYLFFDDSKKTLLAEKKVVVRQTGLLAKADKLTFDVAKSEIRLTGSPSVEQTTDTMRMTSSGMDEIVILRLPNGAADITFTGGKEVIFQAEPITSPAVPPPTPGPPGKGGEASANPFGSLSRRLRIIARERGAMPPSMFIRSAGGGLEFFRATGSVFVETEDFNLRADQLEYDGIAESLEALYNVYLKQADMEADCGRMQYDLRRDKIILSVNPEVRRRDANGLTVSTNMDSFLIQRNKVGPPTTDAIPLAGSNASIEFIPNAPAVNAAPPQKPAEPREINISDDADVDNIPGKSP